MIKKGVKIPFYLKNKINMKQELNKIVEALFEQYQNEDMFYAIDNGNFWFKKDYLTAKSYANKLGKELLTINKPIKIEKPIETEIESEVKIVESKPSKKNNNKK